MASVVMTSLPQFTGLRPQQATSPIKTLSASLPLKGKGKGALGARCDLVGSPTNLGQGIVQYGPYGSQVPQNYRWQVSDSERITQVIVNHGWVVDAIGFQLTRPDGSTRDVVFGGDTNTSRISLQFGEYPTGFSGKYGYSNQERQVGIVTMKVHTNMHPQGYGPYGLAEDVDNIKIFETPLQYGYPLVGVFGACNNRLESIGVLLNHESS